MLGEIRRCSGVPFKKLSCIRFKSHGEENNGYDSKKKEMLQNWMDF